LYYHPNAFAKKKKDQATLAAPSLASDAARLSAGALPVDKAALLDMYQVRASLLLRQCLVYYCCIS
jgi:hypothetical protein